MAKRPVSRSHAGDTGAVPSDKPRRARTAKATPPPPGAPLPPDRPVVRAAETDDRTADPGPRPEALDALEPAQSESTSMASEPSEQDIRMRAYHRYLERGGIAGGEFSDWVEAERELRIRKSEV